MKSKILALLGMGMLAGSMSANATVWYVTGTFADGGTVTGSFDLQTDTCSIGMATASLFTTGGTLIATNPSFSGASGEAVCAFGGGASFIQFGDFYSSIGFAFSSAVTTAGGEVSLLTSSYQLYNPDYPTGQPTFRYLSSGTATTTASSVPVPATLALLGIGLTGLGVARRRKAH